jgi:hypothetical protein
MRYYKVKHGVRLVRHNESYCVKDGAQALAYFYFEDDEIRRNTLQRLPEKDAKGLAMLMAVALEEQDKE